MRGVCLGHSERQGFLGEGFGGTLAKEFNMLPSLCPTYDIMSLLLQRECLCRLRSIVPNG